MTNASAATRLTVGKEICSIPEIYYLDSPSRPFLPPPSPYFCVNDERKIRLHLIRFFLYLLVAFVRWKIRYEKCFFQVETGIFKGGRISFRFKVMQLLRAVTLWINVCLNL